MLLRNRRQLWPRHANIEAFPIVDETVPTGRPVGAKGVLDTWASSTQPSRQQRLMMKS